MILPACPAASWTNSFPSWAGQNHLLLLDCRSRKTELVPMSDAAVSLMIINTNVKHELTGGGYAQRRKQCEEAAKILGVPALRDATAEMLEAAKDQDGRRGLPPRAPCHRRESSAPFTRRKACAPRTGRPSASSCMPATASLRDDYEVSCKELDVVVEIAEDIGFKGGIYGCRMTGGGFGGCAVALVKTELVESLTAKNRRGLSGKNRH